jgi:alkylhydroperoxidase family enzyme
MSDDPRIPPLEPSEVADELAPMFETVPDGQDRPVGAYNIFLTLARHPELFRAWLPFGGHLLGKSTLPDRDRELLILRTAVRCGSSYEWGQHVRISEAVGIDREAITRAIEGSDADGWTPHEAALMRSVDELHDDARISDATWEALAATYDDRQLIEVTILVGHYHLVAFALNSLGVPLDPGIESLPS